MRSYIRIKRWVLPVGLGLIVGLAVDCAGRSRSDEEASRAAPAEGSAAVDADPAATRPATGPGGTDPAGAHFTGFRTQDGFTIAADLHLPTGGSPAPLVLLGHQLYRDRHAWDPIVPRLLAAGFAVLAVDHRTFGESTKEKASPAELTTQDQGNLYFDLLDALAAVADHPRLDLDWIAVGGSGISVDPAVRIARLDERVRAVFLFPGLIAETGREFLLARPDLPVLMLAAEGEVRGRDLQRQWAARFTGPGQEYVEFAATPDDPATWEGTDGLSRSADVVETILWFLERAR